MKKNALLVGLLVLPFMFAASLARALDIEPYTATGLQQAQAAGKPVAVHFHAEWCSTCKAQERAFREIRNDPELKDITLMVADYDTERDLKKAMNVRSQSVIVVFKGTRETARLGGDTKPARIKAALLTAR
jgi:thiol:disulfide interchange protein